MNNILQKTKLNTLDNIVAEDSITPQAIDWWQSLTYNSSSKNAKSSSAFEQHFSKVEYTYG
jgi:hypothetical protein